MLINFISIAYASINDSLCPLLHCLFAMCPLTSSGSCRLQFLCRYLSLFPVALIVVSAYPFFFMYHRTFGMLRYWFVWDDAKIAGDAVALRGDDVAVPDRP